MSLRRDGRASKGGVGNACTCFMAFSHPATLRPWLDYAPPAPRDLIAPLCLLAAALAENGVKRLNIRYIDCRTCQGKIVARLHIHPVKRRCLECFRQSKCSIRCYRRLALYDALYTRAGNAQFLCQGPGAHLKGPKVQLVQNFTRMHRIKNISHFQWSSMVVHNLDFIRSTIGPNKADTPLPVDPNRMLTFAVA